jgi:hypothetical protein
MNKRLSRRAFSRMVAGAFLTGSIVEAAVQETRASGTLSEETALTLLEHIGYTPTLPGEMRTLKPMLEATLRDIQTIRDFQLPFALEPALIFRPDR